MRRFFQFRLRALFVVVTLAAIAALWWSHRLYCLERTAFHQAEIVRCEELKTRSAEEFLANMERELVKSQAESQRQLAAIRAKMEEAVLRGPFLLEAPSRPKRWEDQTVYDSMAQGFLVIPANGWKPPGERAPEQIDDPPKAAEIKSTAKSELQEDRNIVEESNPDEPDLVTSYEAKIAAIDREIAIRNEFAEQYLHAIYRPWIRVDERKLPAKKSP